MAADPETQKWWKITDAMQESFEEGAEGSGKEIPWWTVSVYDPPMFYFSDRDLYVTTGFRRGV